MLRSTVPAAFAAIALGFTVAVGPAAPALAAAVFVETNPSTVPAGDEIGLRASCDDNLRDATVSSDAFGGSAVTVTPRYGFLTATVRIPARTKPHDYRVRLTCPGGESATSTLHVVAKDRPAHGPATGGGGTARGTAAPALIGGGLTAVVGGLLLALFTARRRRLG